MKFKQVKLKHLWRELLMLAVCLFAGHSLIHASVHFSDAGMMKITHNPSAAEPYIIVDLLYFDATDADGRTA